MKAKQQPSGEMAKHSLGFGRGAERANRRAPTGEPLKQRMRALVALAPKNESERELQEAAKRWFHNKRASEKKPPLKIGRTNRVKKGSSK